MVNIKNLGPVPAHIAKWANITMIALISLATLGMWITSPETPFTISFFAWNIVPFVELILTLIFGKMPWKPFHEDDLKPRSAE